VEAAAGQLHHLRFQRLHGNVQLTLDCALANESSHSEMLVSIHDVQTYCQLNAETARSERSCENRSAGCARQRHGIVDGKRSAFKSGLPSEPSALPGRTISGATWKRRAQKLAVLQARSKALATKALWETVRRPSGAGTQCASFAAAFMRSAVGP
jgi:hypothetical protein